jgi:SPRY domain
MGIAATTFDPYYKGAAATLSGSNLVATVSSGTGSVRASNRVTGLIYFEMVVGATLSGSCRIGCCNQSFVFTGLLGVDNNGCGYNSGGTVNINNATVATLAAYAAGNNIGVAIDPFDQKIWFRVNGGNWNNDVIANQNPVGAVGGISISALNSPLSAAWGGSATASATAKFSSASWTYSAPTGFSSLDAQQSNAEFLGPTFDAAMASTWTMTTHAGNIFMGYGGSATAKFISGTIKENGSAVAKTVFLYSQASGALLDAMISNGSTGAFSLSSHGSSQLFAVAFDPTTYQAQVYDQLTAV